VYQKRGNILFLTTRERAQEAIDGEQRAAGAPLAINPHSRSKHARD
jgi:hypothetical protein